MPGLTTGRRQRHDLTNHMNNDDTNRGTTREQRDLKCELCRSKHARNLGATSPQTVCALSDLTKRNEPKRDQGFSAVESKQDGQFRSLGNSALLVVCRSIIVPVSLDSPRTKFFASCILLEIPMTAVSMSQ